MEALIGGLVALWLRVLFSHSRYAGQALCRAHPTRTHIHTPDPVPSTPRFCLNGDQDDDARLAIITLLVDTAIARPDVRYGAPRPPSLPPGYTSVRFVCL